MNSTTPEDPISFIAIELVETFYRKITNATQLNSFSCARFKKTISYRTSKECAIICVSETISQLKNIEKSLLTMKVNLDPIIKFNEQVLEKIKSL